MLASCKKSNKPLVVTYSNTDFILSSGTVYCDSFNMMSRTKIKIYIKDKPMIIYAKKIVIDSN